MTHVPPAQLFELADGRRLAYDEFGAVDGMPVVYLHGTPDSRLSRHPDDSIASALGVRLIAVDRPGYGGSTFDPSGSLLTCGADVARLADHLGLERYATFGWSGGGGFALAVAVCDPARVAAIAIGCSLAPIDAIGVPDVLEGANEQMQLFVVAASQMTAEELPKVVAPLLWPDVHTLDEARDVITASADEFARADIDAVPDDWISSRVRARGTQQRTRRAGTRHRAARVAIWFPLEDVHTRVRLWYGTKDGTATIGAGRYYAQRLANAELTKIAGGSHFLILRHWADILADLAEKVCQVQASDSAATDAIVSTEQH